MSNILVAFDHKENSRLLFDYLSQYHTVISPESPESLNEPFDLGIFDGQALNRLWRQVYLRKETNLPLFLPILLVTPHQEISLITRQLWRIIDEIIFTPIDKIELLVRVEILLRARRFSLELQGKNLQLEQEITTRKEAEDALRESEERFRVALKNSPIVVAHTDSELRYTWIYNEHYFFDGDVIGKQDNELLPVESGKALTDLKLLALENQMGTRGEVTIHNRIYDVTIEPIADDNGKNEGLTTAALDITARKQAEEKSRQLAGLEERQYLARELHDSVNQTLFTINLIADSLPHIWEKRPENMWPQVAEMQRLSQSAMAEMRTLLLELRPLSITKTSIADLYKQLINAAIARRSIELSCDIKIEQSLSEDVHVALYRIAQEALNNIVKHSEASQGRITLVADTLGLKLSIWDNGKGFDTELLTAGLGLGGMRERATAIGATFEVMSKPGTGTEIIISIRDK